MRQGWSKQEVVEVLRDLLYLPAAETAANAVDRASELIVFG